MTKQGHGLGRPYWYRSIFDGQYQTNIYQVFKTQLIRAQRCDKSLMELYITNKIPSHFLDNKDGLRKMTPLFIQRFFRTI